MAPLQDTSLPELSLKIHFQANSVGIKKFTARKTKGEKKRKERKEK